MLAIIVVGIVVFAIIVFIVFVSANDEIKFREFQLKKFRDEQTVKYGTCSLEIDLLGIPDVDHTIMVFEESQTIVIKGKGYNFGDILDFNVNNEMSYKTSTSAGSLIGRSVVGGVLFGGVGAVIGGTSAKQTTEASITNYSINISIRNMACPLVTVDTQLDSICNTITSVLKNIIDQNEMRNKPTIQ